MGGGRGGSTCRKGENTDVSVNNLACNAYDDISISSLTCSAIPLCKGLAVTKSSESAYHCMLLELLPPSSLPPLLCLSYTGIIPPSPPKTWVTDLCSHSCCIAVIHIVPLSFYICWASPRSFKVVFLPTPLFTPVLSAIRNVFYTSVSIPVISNFFNV